MQSIDKVLARPGTYVNNTQPGTYITVSRRQIAAIIAEAKKAIEVEAKKQPAQK